MKKEINSLLNELGVPFSCIGREYIERAVEVIRTQGRVVFWKDLYPRMAEEYITTPAAIDRAIKHAIERACDNLGSGFIREVFGNTIPLKSGKPTNSDFIYGMVKYLEINNKENGNG